MDTSKLTAAKVRAITRTGLHGDGGTLYLNVAPGGSKSWVQRLTVNGRHRDIGLGGFPLVSLAEAREKTFDNRRWARAGAIRSQRSTRPGCRHFAKLRTKSLKRTSRRWRSEQHTQNWLKHLERHAMPHIGDLPVDRIGREDVLRVLTPLWGIRMETARCVRQRVRAVLRWAQAHGFVTENVAGRRD